MYLYKFDSNTETEMNFPEFWKTIEERMNYDPSDIVNVKQILTIFGFTTLQNISILSQKKNMDALELEFHKMKETGKFAAKKNLLDETFSLGTKAIITSVANASKSGFYADQQVNAKATLQRVYDGCKMVKIKPTLFI